VDKHIILGIHITNRMKNAAEVQRLFSEYGCNIKTRVGLHDVHENFCSPAGVVLLELVGDETRCLEMADKVAKVEGIEVQRMVFGHP
jgi:hypothetical protein